jgi:hypothetical protein
MVEFLAMGEPVGLAEEEAEMMETVLPAPEQVLE